MTNFIRGDYSAPPEQRLSPHFRGIWRSRLRALDDKWRVLTHLHVRVGEYLLGRWEAGAVNGYGRCYPSLDTIADALGIAKRTVQEAVSRLIRFGMVRRKNRRSRQRAASNAYLFVYRAERLPRDRMRWKTRLARAAALLVCQVANGAREPLPPDPRPIAQQLRTLLAPKEGALEGERSAVLTTVADRSAAKVAQEKEAMRARMAATASRIRK